ncbi:helix-turn-helix transcriptional regulator [Micromonospora peucetia]|uniref:helix-turn-helix domain-containing protein n=1 Tax=Micromonospora peucetia TaxID=47871 RepID=UPI00332598C2
MSRQELADAVNARTHANAGHRTTVAAGYIGKLERGEHRWPVEPFRTALREVLGKAKDADLGFFIVYGHAKDPGRCSVESAPHVARSRADHACAEVARERGPAAIPVQRRATRQEVAAARVALGRRLAAQRVEAGVTQVDLSRRIPWSRSTVANVETGHHGVHREFWQRCDMLLGAKGELLAAAKQVEEMVRDRRVAALRISSGLGWPQ